MKRFKFKLGSKVRDTVNGFHGKVVAQVRYIGDTLSYEIEGFAVTTRNSAWQNMRVIEEGRLEADEPNRFEVR